MWHHFPVREDLPAGHILRYGFLGVDLFFVLSGYLITTLLLRERRARGYFSLKAFYWRRILRIVPVYYFVITMVGAYYIFAKGQQHYLESWPYYYLFLSNFLTDHIPTLSITWSLAVEEQFYMLWPLALLLLPVRWVVPALLAVIALNVAGVMDLLSPLGIRAFEAGPLDVAMPAATFAPILMGALLAVILDRRPGYEVVRRWLGARIMAPLLLVGLVVVIDLMPPRLLGLPNLAVHAAMTLFLAAVVVRPDNFLAPLLRFAPIDRVGQISYGVYLYHLITLDIANRIFAAAGGQGLLALGLVWIAITLVVAETSFRTLERWFQQFRGRVKG